MGTSGFVWFLDGARIPSPQPGGAFYRMVKVLQLTDRPVTALAELFGVQLPVLGLVASGGPATLETSQGRASPARS